MKKPLNVRAVKEVVRLQSMVLCVFTAGIRVIIAMEPGKSEKRKRYHNELKLHEI